MDQEVDDYYSFTLEDLVNECKPHFIKLRDQGQYDACIKFVEEILIHETMSNGVKASLLSMKACAHIKRNLRDDYLEAVIALQTGLESSRLSKADRATLYTRLGIVWLEMSTISNHVDFAIKYFRQGLDLKDLPAAHFKELLKLNEHAFNLKILQINQLIYSLIPLWNQINLSAPIKQQIKKIKVITPVGELTFAV